jgi:hypothetical protein
MGCANSKAPTIRKPKDMDVALWLQQTCDIPRADASKYARALALEGFEMVSSLQDVTSWPPCIKPGHLTRIARHAHNREGAGKAETPGTPMGLPVSASPGHPPVSLDQVPVAVSVGVVGVAVGQPTYPTTSSTPPSAMPSAMPLANESTTSSDWSARRAALRGKVPSDALNMIDIAFLMDCTGSMGKYMTEAKTKCEEIVAEVETRIAQGKHLRLAFVGYRDFGDVGHIVREDFTRDARTIRDFIGKQEPSGGGDAPEDCLGGLKACTDLSWGGGTNLVVWLADAPNHGARFHEPSMHDDHMDAPDTSEEVLRTLADKKVDLHFVSLNNSTDLMCDELMAQYDRMRRMRFWKHSMHGKVSDFLPTVLKSLKQSISVRTI